jgi:hypothetical protein
LNDSVRIPTLWLAVGLSLLLHLAAFFGWKPLLHMTPFDDQKTGDKTGSLAVRIAPPPKPPPSPRPTIAPQPRLQPVPRPAAPQAAAPAPAPVRPIPAPPVLTVETPSPQSTPAPAPAKPPVADLSAMLAQRRAARGESAPAPAAPPVETEQQRHNRIVAENLGLTRTPTFGTNPDRGGGVFQIRNKSLDYAEFAFFGWNNEVKRNTLQRIEVARGNQPNIEIAIVRRIIEIIRERASGDFDWESPRTGRYMTLSARPADTAELEAFMLKEFFPEYRVR